MKGARCLETRERDGMRWRRYRTEDGRIITTYELPTSVLHGVAPLDRVHARIVCWMRGQARAARRARIADLLANGWKPEAVANEVGVTARTVQKLRQKGLR